MTCATCPAATRAKLARRVQLARLAPHGHAPGADARSAARALAIFNGGNALATVVTTPFGSYLGAVIGWRGAFICLIPFAVLVVVWKLVSMPALPLQGAAKRGHLVALVKRPSMALGLAAVSLLFISQFTMLTYLRHSSQP